MKQKIKRNKMKKLIQTTKSGCRGNTWRQKKDMKLKDIKQKLDMNGKAKGHIDHSLY